MQQLSSQHHSKMRSIHTNYSTVSSKESTTHCFVFKAKSGVSFLSQWTTASLQKCLLTKTWMLKKYIDFGIGAKRRHAMENKQCKRKEKKKIANICCFSSSWGFFNHKTINIMSITVYNCTQPNTQGVSFIFDIIIHLNSQIINY